MTLLIMAAGMGSRYGGIKQIEPVGTHNELIIDYSIFDAIRAGFKKVVFIIRRDIEKDFREAIFDRISKHIKAEYVFQDLNDLPGGFTVPEGRKKPWGTAHAILAARHVIKEPFCAINADDFYGAEAFDKIAMFLKTMEGGQTAGKMKSALVGYKLCNTVSDQGSVSRGVCVADSNDNITEVVERTKIEKRGDKIGYIENEQFHELNPNSDVSMNFWGFSADLMTVLEDKFTQFLKEHGTSEKAEYPIPTVIGEMVADGKMDLKLLKSDGMWLGFTYPEDKIIVKTEIEKMIKDGVYPTPLWK